MRSRLVVVFSLMLAIVFAPKVLAQSQVVRQVPLAQVNQFPATPPINADAGQGPEFDSALIGNDPDTDALN